MEAPPRNYHLYVILDIFGRYVGGWTVALRAAAELAERLIVDTIAKQQIAPGTSTLHADRGTSMRSKPVAALLIDLDIARTHSRPRASDDNPYSESQFRTLEYRPEVPERCGSLEDARTHCQGFFHWYNHEHRHSGIGLMTPHAVHYGIAEALHLHRVRTLQIAYAYAAQPLRLKGRAPQPPALPTPGSIRRRRRPRSPKSSALAHQIHPTRCLKVIDTRRGLEIFRTDPDVPIDTNHLERAMSTSSRA